ncbi:MAG: tetratricopeptide repeat protein, partial [Candidatus Eisenbacteria bacterium]|nr:tetratricopeptide repeat protein [Candidatus Eisenbacteria bacterium]
PPAELGLATALLEAGRPEEAGRLFERVAEANPEHDLRAQALAGAAESYLTEGDIAAAARALGRVAQDYPDSYEAVVARERLRGLEDAQQDTLAPAGVDSLGDVPTR